MRIVKLIGKTIKSKSYSFKDRSLFNNKEKGLLKNRLLKQINNFKNDELSDLAFKLEIENIIIEFNEENETDFEIEEMWKLFIEKVNLDLK